MRLLSISSGKVTPLFGSHHPNYKVVASGINKTSISNLENPVPVEIGRLGIKGDEQADLSVHGGIEKAIYVYPAEHYAFWNELLTRETKQIVELNPGAVGENFTIEGLLEHEVFVGDRLTIGELEFSVVKLREPCFKFNAKMGYKGAAKAMLQSSFCGWYLRVIQTGALQAGEPIAIFPGPRDTSIADQNRALLNRNQQRNLWD
ncbi:MOSC domain-containing protein [Polynucleobacter sphagniphilus]|jgi:MOSC domain-containing protein YiiM|uniref:MOSC domain-containing protein YiiM n=1 Tax=Polynucleobacter sphagniphilus TaxID=1743169 RepID=A0AA43S3Y9_9BURK|nr:MOSC domain-containing protein [Polynucleobacter sphagniphilus]MDF9788646.1 MOSC domain-containing protein YiiM [Polynucleobacter sphagniphilus]MDH6155225.1 MOSC domain-containing protein YiiM [Polynucleobacter sphagniphilus]MDH6241813.1 MOSC domain-containing protein YiiM [Polynucleobacter sphagniphilus]MDH6250179.1 MOSC domain-containing protein YiiM [Polynucleobacter sphagniphilus]MDH6299737.1 MOSC domain-containing protein YiiM [Polynucleobacter sphagniphilus]